MKKLLFVPLGVLALWFYLRHQHSPAEHRLKLARQWVNRLLFFWRGGQRRIEENIKLIFPELGEDEIREAAREAAHTVGANVAYALGSWNETVDEVSYRVEIGPGLRALKERLDQGEKAVVILDHVAPFDGAAPVIEIVGFNAGIVVEKLPPILASFFNRSRLSWEGVNLITTERGQTYTKATEFLNEHGLVAVFIDIFRRPEKADVTCQFGNLQVGVASLPVRLALENNTSLYTLLPTWTDGVIYFEAIEFKIQRCGDIEGDIVLETVRVMKERVEPHISANVRHWMRLFSDDFRKLVR